VKVTAWASLVSAVVLLVPAPMTAVTEILTERDIAQALSVANGSDATRTLFHAPYLVTVDHETVEQLEIITEVRRFVLAAEEQLKAGNWMVGRGGYDPKGRTIKDMLKPRVGQVSLRARLRFHPLNNYGALPPFDILLGEPTLLPIDAIRTPHVTPATGEPGTRDVITGATIEMFYNAPTIGDRVLPVRIMSEGKELLRASVDFSRVE
jgi:hypothetical protein